MSGLTPPPPLVHTAHSACPFCTWAQSGDNHTALSTMLLEHLIETHKVRAPKALLQTPAAVEETIRAAGRQPRKAARMKPQPPQ